MARWRRRWAKKPAVPPEHSRPRSWHSGPVERLADRPGQPETTDRTARHRTSGRSSVAGLSAPVLVRQPLRSPSIQRMQPAWTQSRCSRRRRPRWGLLNWRPLRVLAQHFRPQSQRQNCFDCRRSPSQSSYSPERLSRLLSARSSAHWRPRLLRLSPLPPSQHLPQTPIPLWSRATRSLRALPARSLRCHCPTHPAGSVPPWRLRWRPRLRSRPQLPSSQQQPVCCRVRRRRSQSRYRRRSGLSRPHCSLGCHRRFHQCYCRP
jgi:hypothetical protein